MSLAFSFLSNRLILGECSPGKGMEDTNRRLDNLSRSRDDFELVTTSSQIVETSVNVVINSPSQDYTHPDDHTSPP